MTEATLSERLFNLATCPEAALADDPSVVADAQDAIGKMKAALTATVEYLTDPEIPFPPALHDQITTALGTTGKQTP